MMIKIAITLLLTMCALALPLKTHGQEHTLNILYTGAMQGQLEPCGCSPKTDYGGLARLSGFLNAHADGLSPYLLVDAGNFSPEDTPQGRLKMHAFLRSFSFMKYDAVAFMSGEQAFPYDFLDPLIRKYQVPVLTYGSANTLSLSRGGINVNIAIDPADCNAGTLNILLTDHPVSGGGTFPDCDVIISSAGDALEEPVKEGTTIILSGFEKGKKLGILTLKVDAAGNAAGYQHAYRDIGSDIEEDQSVRRVLDEYDAKVASLVRESEVAPAGETYSGVKKCAECHQVFEESWKKTPHAHAFASLEQAGKSHDPECILCHVVGFGEPGGFSGISTTPELANVQCESCHGLDREHMNDFSSPMKSVTKKICLKCHTKENSPDFDYPVYLKKILHD